MPRPPCSLDDCSAPVVGQGLCNRHYKRMRRAGGPALHLQLSGPPEVRFWGHVDRNGPVPEHRPDLGPCWPWTAYINEWGYGIFWTGERLIPAPRWAYEAERGPLPPGWEPDHLCRRRACVRPSHLEGVPKGVNILRGNGMGGRNARKTHCPKGHEYTPENTYRRPGNPRHRQCRTCIAARRA